MRRARRGPTQRPARSAGAAPISPAAAAGGPRPPCALPTCPTRSRCGPRSLGGGGGGANGARLPGRRRDGAPVASEAPSTVHARSITSFPCPARRRRGRARRSARAAANYQFVWGHLRARAVQQHQAQPRAAAPVEALHRLPQLRRLPQQHLTRVTLRGGGGGSRARSSHSEAAPSAAAPARFVSSYSGALCASKRARAPQRRAGRRRARSARHSRSAGARPACPGAPPRAGPRRRATPPTAARVCVCARRPSARVSAPAGLNTQQRSAPKWVPQSRAARLDLLVLPARRHVARRRVEVQRKDGLWPRPRIGRLHLHLRSSSSDGRASQRPRRAARGRDAPSAGATGSAASWPSWRRRARRAREALKLGGSARPQRWHWE